MWLQAIKQGSIEGLNRCLQENQYRFIQAGTYLLLEKLKHAVYRRLFKRVALIHREQEPAKAAHVPLGATLLSDEHFTASAVFQTPERGLQLSDASRCLLSHVTSVKL